METPLLESSCDEHVSDFCMGIDLGTRYSCVGIWNHKKFEVIPDKYSYRTMPSVVTFYGSARIVGNDALKMKEANPKNTIYDVKRILGRRIDDPILEATRKLLSYELVDDQSKYRNIMIKLDNSDAKIRHKQLLKPEEVCGYILNEIRRNASAYLKSNVKKAVITVPAYFNDAQRQATLDSAKVAGLEVLKIINEPTAAALAYGLGNKNFENEEGNIIIYDLGAGTLDVSLMNICNGTFRTLAVSGNTNIGGEDIDYLIMNHVLLDFQKQLGGKKITELNKLTQHKLKTAAENAKKILSTNQKALICIDNFYQGKKLCYSLTREIFENICNELFIMAIKPIVDVLESSGLSKYQVDEVVLVGGSTRIPKIKELILNYFDDTKIKRLTTSVNPDEIVAAGAAIYAYIMTHQEDPFTNNLTLLDITPLSLGVETLQKQMTTIIPRNTVIPVQKTKIFSTDTDDQDSVLIKIFEGERKLTKHNFHVGTFELTGFTKAPRGCPIIQITFKIDINGILQVTAVEKKSDAQNSITITSTWGAKGRLSKNEIDKLIKEAETHEEIDLLYSTRICLAYKIRSMCHAIEMNLSTDTCLTVADKKVIHKDIAKHIQWLDTTNVDAYDVDDLKKKMDRLSKLYAPLVIIPNKENDKFQDQLKTSTAAEVEGDDELMEDQTYATIVSHLDPSEFDKEEIKAIKKTIFDLCKNITSIANSPVSNIHSDDVAKIKDYIDTVIIWIYTTTSVSTTEYITKIDEINKVTEEIMKKYDGEIFEKDNTFTSKDELQLTCLTLNSSIKSNFFSLKKNDTDTLHQVVNETFLWLLSHQNEEAPVYQEKLDYVCKLCNEIYQNTHKIKSLQDTNNNSSELNDESDSSDEEILLEPNPKNKINESIDDLLDKLPDRITTRKQTMEKSNVPTDPELLVKVDFNKLHKEQSFAYHQGKKTEIVKKQR